LKKLFLLDGMALIYQAFYAYKERPLINSKGMNTSAVQGFANVLYKLLKEEKPTHIGVAFDTMAPTARHEGFIEYKANRQRMPEDLAASIPYIKRLIEAFNIPTLFVDGYEADDVIGTLAKEAEKAGYTVYMMTPDKDFGQLVSENVLIYKPGKFGEKPVIMGPAEVCEKFGIKDPLQVIDMLGIWGDAADNIPGIPGIGEKGAQKLIEKYGSLENILANIETVEPESMRTKIINGTDLGIQSKQLATIILDVPIDFSEENLHLDPPNPAALRELFEELEFRTFAKRVFTDLSLQEGEQAQSHGQPQPQAKSTPSAPDLFSELSDADSGLADSSLRTIENTPHEYILADDGAKIKELISILSASPSFCFDTETTGLETATDELVGLSFAVEPSKAWYVPVPAGRKEALALLENFRPVFENEKFEKTGQNMKFDIEMLSSYGIRVKGKLFDTMIAHYLLEPDMRHNMDVLSQNYLYYRPVSIETLIGKKGKDQLTMRMVPLEQIKEYAAEDADVTLQLRNVFEPRLAQTGTRKLFDEIEMPLVPVLAAMELEGVKLDTKALSDYSVELGKEILELQQQIWQMAGSSFNIQSPKQLGEILYERLKITENVRKTATKQYSTAEDVLVKLAHKHPIVQTVLDYRSLTKLKSTYVDVLPTLVNPVTGRVHTSYNQAVAATGRLSSNNPNLQNIPIRTERGREIRKAFVPRGEEFTLLSADYSQIELRIIASISNDEGMMAAFRDGMDIHTATAATIYGISPEEVTRDQRRNAKSVNFGIIYGISAFGLSENIGISRKEAGEIIDQYFAKFPGIKKYMDETIRFAREHEYVETIMGRRRYIRDINSANGVMRGFAERNAINAPIQGSAADMIKIAMIRIHDEFQRKQLKSRMILQVHDELIFDAHRDETETVKSVVRECMQNAILMKVPIEVEMNTGANWLEAH
jgi:DNA polymerase-1